VSGMLFEWPKFFFICITNGTYIMSHNKLRRFDNRIIRANFFRSLLAWPFASIFAPIGNYFMIPSIVQAKFWSDFVAGVIEGAGKYRLRMSISQRDLSELLPKVASDNRKERFMAILDILYIWAKRKRGKTCLHNLLLQKQGSLRSLLDFHKKVDDNGGQSPVLANYREALVEQLTTEGALVAILLFIQEHYSDQEALFLSDMVGENFMAFHKWLKQVNRRAKKQGIESNHIIPQTMEAPVAGKGKEQG
jgi:hypothetical protein